VSGTLDSSALLEAGRSIRPFLDELGLSELDAGLAAALVEPDPDAAAEQVLALLMAHRPAAEWLVGFSAYGVPPQLAETPVRGYAALPGHGDVVRAPRFCCPVAGDYVWYRRSAGQPIRSCPTHSVRLVPDAS
jgi:hypothetical protein